MDINQKMHLHITQEKDGNEYTFSIPAGAHLADAADVAFGIFKACDKMYREAIDKEIKKREESEKEAENKADDSK